MKKIISVIVMMAMLVAMSLPVMAADGFKYQHDPRLNSKAMEDIVVDEAAVYGFKPKADSKRLGSYADADWTDKEAVAKWKEERIAYLADYQKLYDKWDEMEAAGSSVEEIARELSGLRNQIRIDSYKDDPDGLAKLKASNLETYGNEDGPTPDSLFEKYGSWEKVISKAFSSNCGMDACLGLYDDQYEKNLKTGEIVESDVIIYVVAAGDYLAKIAKEQLGDAKKYMDIFNANKDVIKDPNKIWVGQELVIPVN